LLFASTERAVWVSFDDGGYWHSLQLNLPYTSMRDFVIHGDDIVLGTHGRSFWILDDSVHFANLRSGVMSSKIQNDRPWVPRTMSSPWMTKSRMESEGG